MASSDVSGGAAIVGLGISDVGRVYGKSASQLAADAVLKAVADAGLELSDVDGVLMSNGLVPNNSLVAANLGLRNLKLSANIQSFGATATAAMQYGSMAVQSGMARAGVAARASSMPTASDLAITGVPPRRPPAPARRRRSRALGRPPGSPC